MKGWIVRDSGSLNRDKKGFCFFFYDVKPIKYMTGQYWYQSSFVNHCFPVSDDELPEGINPQWEDDDPVECEMVFRPITH